MRRLLSPIGFALAFLCLWLPFLLGGPQPPGPLATVAPSITYTGVDLVLGGRADVLVPTWRPDGSLGDPVPTTDIFMYGRPQPTLPGSVYGVVAVLLLAIGALASLIPVARSRAIVASGAAIASALALLALELAQRREVARLVPELLGPLLGLPTGEPAPMRFVSMRIGFWAALALLIVISFAQGMAGAGSPRKAVPAPPPPG